MSKSLLLRQQAFNLRARGYSYTYIGEKIKISKSTLSDWLSSVPYSPNKEMLIKLGNARAASGLAKHKLKLQCFKEAGEQARKEIGLLSERDVFMLGIGLYLGEGTKTHDIVRVINANSKVIRFAVRWFQEVCGLPLSNFKLRLHVYPDNNVQKCIQFWSKEVQIPESQFQETQIDFRKDKKRFKRGKLPYGTAHLSIRSGGEKRFGVFLARKINAWIEEVLK